jgi:hypothetical protein
MGEYAQGLEAGSAYDGMKRRGGPGAAGSPDTSVLTRMYLPADQLRRNLEALDSAALAMKVQSGQLTPDAHAMALSILHDRGVEPGPAEAPSSSLTRPEARAAVEPDGRGLPARPILALYIAFVIACTLVVFADPPWVAPRNGTWDGTIGFLASLASGAPWSIGLLIAFGDRMTTMQGVVGNWVCVGINVALLVRYIRQR